MNTEMYTTFEESDYPEDVKRAYKCLLIAHPKLSCIQIELRHDDVPASYVHREGVNSDSPPYITLNIEWQVIANAGLELPERELDRDLLKEKLGVESISQELMVTYVIFHEFGHAYSYYNMNGAQRREYREKSFEGFKQKWGVTSVGAYKKAHPEAPEELILQVARDYKKLAPESAADNLAIEFLKKLRRNFGLFPEISITM